MPSGKIHQRVNEAAILLGTPTAFALTWYATSDVREALEITAYAVAGMLFGTYFADPDLDQDHITRTEARIRRWPIVGLPLYAVFIAFWYPYAKQTHHRGVSHWPVIGTLLRLGYILLVFMLINTIGRWIIFGNPKGWGNLLLSLILWMVRHPAQAGAWIVGECLADMLHALTDRLWPAKVHTASVRWRLRNRA